MVISIIIISLGMVPKNLEKRVEKMEIRGRTKTIQNIADFSEKLPVRIGVKNSLGITNGSPHLGQKSRPYNNQQKKRTCKIVDLACLG